MFFEALTLTFLSRYVLSLVAQIDFARLQLFPPSVATPQGATCAQRPCALLRLAWHSNMAASFTATAAAAEIRHGSISGFQYLAALVERWDSTQKFANALLLKDEGLQALRRNIAEETAESTRTGKRFAATGALASVPFVVSPSIDARGYSIHGGNAALGAGQATRDAPVLAALYSAGACLFGLSNTAELGQPGLQAHSVHGLVKNVRRRLMPCAILRCGRSRVRLLLLRHAIDI
jgi:hypothetical protein